MAYLAVGVLLGPHALGNLAGDTPACGTRRYLGEFGVVFLMFSLGLEFNLAQADRDARATCSGSGRRRSASTIA